MIYLDNAATTFPKPEEVYNEVLNCMKNYAGNPGRGSHDMAIAADLKITETRINLSKLFNIANPLNIVFTKNGTEALNIAIKGILKPKDHVITTVLEHNSVLRPLHSLIKNNVDVTFISSDEQGHIDLNLLKKEIRKNTKAIIINHASNVIGTVQPIEEIGNIAKEEGIKFIVDGSQSAGNISIDVDRSGIDILAVAGHKGLLGPQGTGMLYIKEGMNLKEHNQGGTGSQSQSLAQPDFLPDKFESGTLNTSGIAGLCQGVKFILKKGLNNIQMHKSMLVKYLVEELSKLPYVKIYGGENYNNRCSIVSINIGDLDSSKVGYILNKKGFAVRVGYHCAPLIHGIIGTRDRGTIRISPGYFNTLEDIEKLIEVIKDIKK